MTSRRLNRRRLLLIGAALAVRPMTLAVAAVPPAAPRRLHLVNPHTGETFDGPYRDGRSVLASAMADLSAFLRDFHCGAQIAMDPGVIDFLAAVMDAVGARSAAVLSAYRTPQTNAMLARTTFGVAEHSQHMFGRALDVRIDGDLGAAMRAARAMERGGVGWYPASGFMHIDSGPVRNWDLDDRGLVPVLAASRRFHPHREEGAPRETQDSRILAKWANSGRPLPALARSGHLLPQVARQ